MKWGLERVGLAGFYINYTNALAASLGPHVITCRLMQSTQTLTRVRTFDSITYRNHASAWFPVTRYYRHISHTLGFLHVPPPLSCTRRMDCASNLLFYPDLFFLQLLSSLIECVFFEASSTPKTARIQPPCQESRILLTAQASTLWTRL